MLMDSVLTVTQWNLQDVTLEVCSWTLTNQRQIQRSCVSACLRTKATADDPELKKLIDVAHTQKQHQFAYSVSL